MELINAYLKKRNKIIEINIKKTSNKILENMQMKLEDSTIELKDHKKSI